MACINPHLFSHKFRSSFTTFHVTKSIATIPNRQLKTSPRLSTIPPLRSSAHSHSLPVIPDASSRSFTWDDVVRVSQPEYAPHDSSDLSGFFDKIRYCNRGSVILFFVCLFLITRKKSKSTNGSNILTLVIVSGFNVYRK